MIAYNPARLKVEKANAYLRIFGLLFGTFGPGGYGVSVLN
jgi:hypothetical protein